MDLKLYNLVLYTLIALLCYFIYAATLEHYTSKLALQKNQEIEKSSYKSDENRAVVKHHYIIDKHFDENCAQGLGTSYISVNISYPQLTAVKNKKVQKHINKILRQISTQDTIKPLTSYEVNYEIEHLDANILSIIFTFREFQCNASHPTIYYKNLMYNLIEGREYKPSEIVQGEYFELFRQKLQEYYEGI